jgi:Leucine-rich repeat (LRR) protein
VPPAFFGGGNFVGLARPPLVRPAVQLKYKDSPASQSGPARQRSFHTVRLTRNLAMRNHAARLLFAALTVTAVLFAAPTAFAVQFPDKNLEAALRALVFEKKANAEELTEDDLRKISTLEAKGRGIQNLAGLEKCTNLLLLDISNNEVVDIAPLKSLVNLQSLTLAGNKIVDLVPIMELEKLQYLNLTGNQVRLLQPLSAMTKLSALYLAENQIENVAPLAGLTRLSSLDLAKNKIVDITPLANIPRLNVLKLSDNAVVDIAPAVNHPPQSMLLLERNKVADLKPLVAAAQTDAGGQKNFAPFLRLYLEGNPLSDAAKGEQLTALKGAGVRIEN